MNKYERRERELMADNEEFTRLPHRQNPRKAKTQIYQNNNWIENVTVYALRNRGEWEIKKGKISKDVSPKGTRLFLEEGAERTVLVGEKEYDYINGYIWCINNPDENRMARKILERKLEDRDKFVKALQTTEEHIRFLKRYL